MVDGSENAHFVQSVLGLLVGEMGQFDFFESVCLGVRETLDFVDCGVGAFSWVGEDVPSLARRVKSLIDMLV